MVDGVLYALLRNAGNSRLGWSSRSPYQEWTWADWNWAESFGCPTFLNFGANYAGARDGFVYIYSLDGDSAYEQADRMVLARVPADGLREQDAYEYYAGSSDDGVPQWSANIADRQGVFEHRGRCYRLSVSYNAALKRYLWVQILPGGDTRYRGGLAIYDAPEPWGPWTTAYFAETWDVGPGESASLTTKWMSDNGTSVTLVFSGDDSFSTRAAKIVLRK